MKCNRDDASIALINKELEYASDMAQVAVNALSDPAYTSEYWTFFFPESMRNDKRLVPTMKIIYTRLAKLYKPDQVKYQLTITCTNVPEDSHILAHEGTHTRNVMGTRANKALDFAYGVERCIALAKGEFKGLCPAERATRNADSISLFSTALYYSEKCGKQVKILPDPPAPVPAPGGGSGSGSVPTS
ncbi:hypothetical protein DFH06DRAFT_1372698 [Mycena polygramma]|nr:hypothetical protein DFH06DRAFT_1372698 [Mycena polygramma]